MTDPWLGRLEVRPASPGACGAGTQGMSIDLGQRENFLYNCRGCRRASSAGKAQGGLAGGFS